MTVDIYEVVKFVFAEFLQYIGLAHLSCTEKYKRLMAWIILPFEQFLVYFSLHLTWFLVSMCKVTESKGNMQAFYIFMNVQPRNNYIFMNVQSRKNYIFMNVRGIS